MTRNSGEYVPSDEDLACRARQGCAASFEQLLRRFQTPLLHFLRRRGFSADAEDLTQETLLRAYENLHRYNRRWAFSTWLFTIARRTSLNHRRRTRPMADTRVIEAALAAAPAPLETMVAAESRRRLWDRAAAVLSEEQTTALWLYYVEEMPAREIARVLGRSWASVKVLLFRARKRLLPSLAEFAPESARAARNARENTAGQASSGTQRKSPVIEELEAPMSKRRRSKEEELLAERLRREAIESRPAFSESLHRRILAAVEERQAAEANAAEHCLCQAVAHAGEKQKRAARRWSRIVAAALAAACLLGAVAIGWQLMANASRQSRIEKMQQVADLPSIRDLTDHTVGRLDRLSVAAALEPQTTPLKHDARAVASVFLDRLPVSVGVANSR